MMNKTLKSQLGLLTGIFIILIPSCLYLYSIGCFVPVTSAWFLLTMSIVIFVCLKVTRSSDHSFIRSLFLGLIISVIYIPLFTSFSFYYLRTRPVKAANKPIVILNAEDHAKISKVIRVVDGVMLELENGQMVRLIGIQAPEDEKMGQEATEFVRSLNIKDEKVRLEYDVEKRDK